MPRMTHNCSLDSLYQNFTKGLYDQILKLQTAPLLGHKWNLKFLELIVMVPPLQNINLVHSDSVTFSLSLQMLLVSVIPSFSLFIPLVASFLVCGR